MKRRRVAVEPLRAGRWRRSCTETVTVGAAAGRPACRPPEHGAQACVWRDAPRHRRRPRVGQRVDRGGRGEGSADGPRKVAPVSGLTNTGAAGSTTKVMVVAAGAEVVEVEPGGRAVPPAGVRRGGVVEPVGVAGGGVAEVVEVVGVAAVDVVLEVPEVVGLHEGDFVVGVGGVGSRCSGCPCCPVRRCARWRCREAGEVGVAAGLLAVLDQEVLGGDARAWRSGRSC